MKKQKLPPYPLGGTPEEIRKWVRIYWSLFRKVKDGDDD